VQLVRRTGFDPDLRRAIGLLADEDLLPTELVAAHDFLTRLLVTLRLVAPDVKPPAPATRPVVAHAVGAKDWDEALAALDRHRQAVAGAWAAVSEQQEQSV